MSSGGGGGQFPQYGQNSYGRMGGYGQSYAPDPRMAQFQPMRVQDGGQNSSIPSWANQNQSGGFPVPPQMPIFPGQTTTSEGGWATAGQPRGGINPPQISGPFNPMVGSQMNKPMPMEGPQMSAPNVQTQTPMSAPMQQQRPQQSFEQFAQTLGNNGMTSGQMQDAYQKSISSQSSPNFWANTGVGTQKPAGFSTPPQWGNQTYGFDPRSMAGKTVGQDMAWYYGQDSVGRNINNAGDAVANGRVPADGFQRRAPWQL